METKTIKFSDIVKHPSMRMDASYHIGKKNGKKAFKKVEKGLIVEDDINGKVMLYEADAKEYNEAVEQVNEKTETLRKLKDKNGI